MYPRFAVCFLSGLLVLIALAGAGAQNTPEQEVRSTIERFYHAHEARDHAGLMSLWSPESPDYAAESDKARSKFHRMGRIVVKQLNIEGVRIDGKKATVKLLLDWQGFDARTGRPASEFWTTRRKLTLRLGEGGWKVISNVFTALELAARIAVTQTESDAQALLASDPFMPVTDIAVSLAIQGSAIAQSVAPQAALKLLNLGVSYAEEKVDRFGLMALLNQRGLVYDMLSDARSMEDYRRSAEIAQAIGDMGNAAASLGNIGILYIEQGRFDEALKSMNRVRAIFEQTARLGDLGRTWFNMGALYATQGDRAQALRCYEKAAALKKQTGDIAAGYANARKHVGEERYSLGNPTGAAQAYAEARGIFESLRDQKGLADLAYSWGRNLREAGDIQGALREFHRMIENHEMLGDGTGQARGWREIAGCFHQQVRMVEMSKALEEALKRLPSTTSGWDAQECWFLMAHVSAHLKMHQRAIECFQKAMQIPGMTARTQFALHAGMAESLKALGRTDAARESLSRALAIGQEYLATVEASRTRVVGSEADRARFHETAARGFSEMVGVCVDLGRFEDALRWTERSRARSLVDVLGGKRDQIGGRLTRTEQETERRVAGWLTLLNGRLFDESQSRRPDSARLASLTRQRDEARLALEAFRARLYSDHPELRAKRVEEPPITLREAGRLLPDESSALLEFVYLDNKTFLIAITPARAHGAAPTLRIYTIPLGEAPLRVGINRFLNHVADRNRGYSQDARRLFDILLKPALKQIGSRRTWIISPDGLLWDLPFQALMPRPNRFLLEDHVVYYAPSFTALRAMTTPARAFPVKGPTYLLAFGNPSVSAATIQYARRGGLGKLASLPEAEREARQVAALYPAPIRVFTGKQATESRFKREAAQARVLHLAGHAYADGDNPLYSFIILSQDSHDPSQDGLLEAHEIMDLELNARMAVLSACDTARGRISRGEGVIGLAWAFFVAGCPATVVSQWQVDSSSTTSLMVGFHRALAQRKAAVTRAAALRDAALAVMRRPGWRHPFYWAGFVLIGDGR